MANWIITFYDSIESIKPPLCTLVAQYLSIIYIHTMNPISMIEGEEKIT